MSRKRTEADLEDRRIWREAMEKKKKKEQTKKKKKEEPYLDPDLLKKVMEQIPPAPIPILKEEESSLLDIPLDENMTDEVEQEQPKTLLATAIPQQKEFELQTISAIEPPAKKEKIKVSNGEIELDGGIKLIPVSFNVERSEHKKKKPRLLDPIRPVPPTLNNGNITNNTPPNLTTPSLVSTTPSQQSDSLSLYSTCTSVLCHPTTKAILYSAGLIVLGLAKHSLPLLQPVMMDAIKKKGTVDNTMNKQFFT